MSTARTVLLALASTALLLTGCGGGDLGSENVDVTQTDSLVQEYCRMSAELDAQQGTPSEEQLAEIESAAPPEILEEVNTLVEAVRNQDFENPDVAAAEETLLEWEQENCPDSLEVDPGPEATATP